MNFKTTVWLFPGQGSQFPGMGRDLCKSFAPAERIFALAEDISGQPLRRYSWQGPAETLKRTDILQPAVTALNLGCAALLRDAGYNPQFVAGHSLGEFSALQAAGVLSVQDTLRLVVARGRLMQESAERLDGGLLAIKRLQTAAVERILSEQPAGRELCIANQNTPEQTVISGDWASLRALQPAINAAGGEGIALDVAGPWHSKWMEEAAATFAALLDNCAFEPPACRVFLNTTGAEASDAEAIRAAMRQQMTSPVRWQAAMQALRGAGASVFYEVGPGRVLRGLLRGNWPDESAYTVRGVDGPQALKFLAAENTAA
jgi:[acyl-carrier-protein] S-malonyltransferase